MQDRRGISHTLLALGGDTMRLWHWRSRYYAAVIFVHPSIARVPDFGINVIFPDLTAIFSTDAPQISVFIVLILSIDGPEIVTMISNLGSYGLKMTFGRQPRPVDTALPVKSANQRILNPLPPECAKAPTISIGPSHIGTHRPSNRKGTTKINEKHYPYYSYCYGI